MASEHSFAFCPRSPFLSMPPNSLRLRCPASKKQKHRMSHEPTARIPYFTYRSTLAGRLLHSFSGVLWLFPLWFSQTVFTGWNLPLLLCSCANLFLYDLGACEAIKLPVPRDGLVRCLALTKYHDRCTNPPQRVYEGNFIPSSDMVIGIRSRNRSINSVRILSVFLLHTPEHDYTVPVKNTESGLEGFSYFLICAVGL
jgi:hypothetical protein